jgi:hypothetical protein
VSPSHSDATRRQHLGALLRSRGATFAFVLGVPAVVIAGIAVDNPLIVFGGPVAVVAVVLGVSLLIADRLAAQDFFSAYARRRGWTYVGQGTVMPLTPLLAAGHRRSFEHLMEGPLGSAGDAPCRTALYTYEIVEQRGKDKGDRKEARHFTVCAIDLPPAMSAFGGGGIYVHPRRALRGLVGDDYLKGLSVRGLEVESAAFAERYDLLVEPEVDEIMVRRLFAPSLVAWLAEHPLRPCFELRAGTLVVFVPGPLEATGRLDFFLDAAAHLATKVLAETPQTVAV